MAKTLEQKINTWRGDYQSYAKDNLFIINKDAETVPLIFNRMQRRVWLLLFKLLQEGKPIRIICIKDRQVGFTTFIAGFFYWLSTLFPNRNCLIASHDIDSAAGIFGKIKLFYKMSAPELRPLRKTSNRRELYFANPNEEGELGLESRIVIDTADSKELGVSYTLQCALLSELAIWEAMGLDIKYRLVALHQAIPEKPGTAIIIETTPRGEGKVSEMWNDEDNGYIKIFISSVADEEYRIELSKDNYFELSSYEEHKYGDETEEYEYYEKEVKFWYPELKDESLLHHEIMCRLAWRRDTIDKKCDGDKAIFDREYPITIDKAFASSGSNLFDVPKLNEIKQYVTDFPHIITSYRFFKGLNYLEDDFYQSSGGLLKIFRSPQEGKKYIIGGDGGQGVKGGDNSALSCRSVPDLKHIFTLDGLVKPYEFARMTLRLCMLYNNAFLGMEINDKGGFAAVQYLLHTFHYVNLYQREVTLEINEEKQEKYGWRTDRFRKPTMINDWDELLKTGELEILDMVLLNQAKKYILFTTGKKGEIGLSGASSGKDDLLLADMICIQMAKEVHQNIIQEKPRFKYTLDWWAQQASSEDLEIIGNNLRGPKDWTN